MPTALDYLITAQHDLGGWGYSTGSSPVVEPSVVALLALLKTTTAERAFQKGITCLLNAQNPDGGWGINENDDESSWHTTWAAICLQKSGQTESLINRALDWIVMKELPRLRRWNFKQPCLEW